MSTTLREAINGELILAFIDGLGAIGVIECEFWVCGHLRENVDASID